MSTSSVQLSILTAIQYSDYNGALAAGMTALLLQRSGLDGEQAHKPPQEQGNAVQAVKNLDEVIQWVRSHQ